VEDKTMKNIELTLKSGISYGDAEKAARKAALDMASSVSLFAWYDKAKNTGAPSEACARENWKCVRDYATHHNADIRVSVNEDEYEFFFSKSPAGATTLDSEEVSGVHKGISEEFDNIQGG
jgi:hypothetical protein